ncbi:hypothetical protein [Nannocystis pusilla]|uniref:hypothetical protein n=1 Tax=Nannocystis pusilla TaxID=889268 RepID=UPI003B833EAA
MLAGRPLREPMARRGPFVMNTDEAAAGVRRLPLRAPARLSARVARGACPSGHVSAHAQAGMCEGTGVHSAASTPWKAIGRVTVKVEPWPGALRASMPPRIISA